LQASGRRFDPVCLHHLLLLPLCTPDCPADHFQIAACESMYALLIDIVNEGFCLLPPWGKPLARDWQSKQNEHIFRQAPFSRRGLKKKDFEITSGGRSKLPDDFKVFPNDWTVCLSAEWVCGFIELKRFIIWFHRIQKAVKINNESDQAT
jgi:hypothetical protein